MAKLYVPDKAYLVCSEGMKTQQIKVSSQSTIKIANGRLAATIKDRTGANFVCAKMVLAGAIIGVAIAAVVAAAIVLSGGTLAIGLGAMLAAGALGGAAAGLRTALIPCACALLTMGKDWAPVHPKVTFEDKKALIETSVVPCRFGGIVKILYSKEAAEALAAANRSKAIAGVAAVTTVAFLGGTMVAALGSAALALQSTYLTFGLGASIVHFGGMATAGGMSFGANYVYDEVKNYTHASEYIDGSVYTESDERHNQLDDVVEIATDKRTGAVGDALGSSEDIGKHQTAPLITNTTTTQSVTTNNVFVAGSNGTVVPPGTVVATQSTVTASNAIPLASPSRSGTTVILSNSESTIIRSTANTVEATRISSVTTSSTQFNNLGILSSTSKAYFGKYGLNFLKGMGTNMFFDAVRAGGNWLVSNELKAYSDALKTSELAARKSITVIEDEV
ncbi:PAAR-like protein [Mucilaginibacter lacusdianchii]|uniref:PAAR-like protein n=1 Tax=Mucilaginibacter lacusdianchii TaxID=2684211 RepID=UPI00131BC523|nr:PAAR-like protein [Mucilaginibacter sp. JXJ CY 39]